LIEEFGNIMASFFSPDNLLTLMFIIDFFAVIGIFANAFTHRGAPSNQRKRRIKPKPRQVDANKLYYNLEESLTQMEGEDGVKHVKKAVGDKLKPNGKLETFPLPLKEVPEGIEKLVHNAKNNVETPKTESEKTNVEVPKAESKKTPLGPTGIREIVDHV